MPDSSPAIDLPRRPQEREVELLTPEARKEARKLSAAYLGAEMLGRAMAERGLSLREVARLTGIDVARLSEIARAKSRSGPHLWVLLTIADALGYDLDLTLTPRG